jgi:hypothetical protein
MISLALWIACAPEEQAVAAPEEQVVAAPVVQGAASPELEGALESGVRLRDTAAGLVLEVASDAYRAPDGRELLVVGAVHLADSVFYEVSVARLASLDGVLLEGFVDDVEPFEDAPSGTAIALGLVSQSTIDVEREGWIRRDLAESELQAQMRADGVSEDDIRSLLVSEPGATKPPVTDTPRGVALGRLRLMHNLVTDETSPLWKRYMLGARDAHVTGGVDGLGERVGIWFGADHLAGIGRHLSAAGWSHESRTWTPAISVNYTDMQLGPVQVSQLRQGWSR